MAYPDAVVQLIEAFRRFPGIGAVTAERLAFHVLRDPRARELARSIDRAVEDPSLPDVRQRQRGGPVPHLRGRGAGRLRHRGGGEPRRRKPSSVRGLPWPVPRLMGALNPADGTEAAHLSVAALVRRVQEGGVQEVVSRRTRTRRAGHGPARPRGSRSQRLRGPVVTRLARGSPPAGRSSTSTRGSSRTPSRAAARSASGAPEASGSAPGALHGQPRHAGGPGGAPVGGGPPGPQPRGGSGRSGSTGVSRPEPRPKPALALRATQRQVLELRQLGPSSACGSRPRDSRPGSARRPGRPRSPGGGAPRAGSGSSGLAGAPLGSSGRTRGAGSADHALQAGPAPR